jgi:hypothetical protein
MDTISDLTFKPSEKLTITLPEITVSNEKGYQPLGLTVGKINGKDEDGNPENNNINDSVYVFMKSIQRTVLHEGFTSSTCAPCVGGNQNVKAVQDANPNKFALIKYQMNWPDKGDPYYTAEGGERKNYYGVSSVPHFFANGAYWEGSSYSYTSQLLNRIYAIPSEVEFSDVDASIGAKTVTFNAKVNTLVPFDKNVRFFAAIVEKKTAKNVGTNGETVFENVFKKFLTKVGGDSLGVMQADSSKSFELEWTFKGEYRLPANATSPINHNTEHSVEDWNNLAVVYWVQDAVSGYVFQSGITGIGVTSITDKYVSLNSIYPNPVKNAVTIDLKESAKVTIFTIDGVKLFEENREEGQSVINMNVPSGTYILRTETPQGSATTKFVVE